MNIADHYVDVAGSIWDDDIEASVCRQCGALVHYAHLEVHIAWHANADPVKAFREHWRRS